MLLKFIIPMQVIARVPTTDQQRGPRFFRSAKRTFYYESGAKMLSTSSSMSAFLSIQHINSIINKPSTHKSWATQTPTSRDPVELLNAGSEICHAADPNLEILTVKPNEKAIYFAPNQRQRSTVFAASIVSPQKPKINLPTSANGQLAMLIPIANKVVPNIITTQNITIEILSPAQSMKYPPAIAMNIAGK